jgi:hypothetical protein
MNKLSLKICLISIALCSGILSSCTESEPNFNNISFDYSGANSGHFQIYSTENSRIDTATSLPITIFHDTTLMFFAVDWGSGHTVGNMIGFILHSTQPFSNNQIFTTDSLSSHISSSIGLNAPISLTRSINGGDIYQVIDSSAFFPINMVFKLSKYLNDSSTLSLSMAATFSGTFKNLHGGKLIVSNGSINIPPHP